MRSDKAGHSSPIPSATSSDDWPLVPDGSEWDGKNLLDFVRKNISPFGKIWDVSLLLREVESKLHAEVVDASVFISVPITMCVLHCLMLLKNLYIPELMTTSRLGLPS